MSPENLDNPVPNKTDSHHHGVSRRLFSNTILNFGGQGFLLVLNFATAPYIVHHLGAEMFGILALVQVTAGFAGFLNLGIGRALTKYVSGLYWKGDIKAINELFQTAWTTCIVSGLVALCVIAGPRATIARLLLRGGPETNNVADYAIFIAALGLFSSMLLEGVSGIPGALQRFDLYNSVNVLMGVCRALGPVVLIAMGYSIRAVLAMNLIANLVGIVAFALVSRHLIHGLRFVPHFKWAAFKRLFDFSLPLLLSAMSALIVTRLDRFILAYYLPLAAVAFYTLPYSLSEKLSMGVTNVTSVVFPFTSELHAREAHDKVQELYVRSTKMLTLVTFPLTVILLTIPGPILRYWLGPEFAAQGTLVLAMLGIATYLYAASAIPTVTALGIGRAWVPAIYALSGSVINIVVNLTLIPRYGINGAALAALLHQALIVPFFIYHVNHLVKFSLWKLVSEAFLRPFACGAVQFAVLFMFRRFIFNLPSLGLVCLLSLSVFGVLALFGALRQDERNALFGGLSRWNLNRRVVVAESAVKD